MNVNDPTKHLKTGDTFKCGPNGSITGTILAACSEGAIYKLDKPVRVFKRVYRYSNGSFVDDKRTTIELEIPAGTKIRAEWAHHRNTIENRKCRAERAIVISAPRTKGKDTFTYRSMHLHSFIYAEGLTVTPQYGFNEYPYVQCGSGIHFFFSKTDAHRYDF